MNACERSGRRAASVAAIALLTMVSITAARADGFPNGVTPPGAGNSTSGSPLPGSSVGSGTAGSNTPSSSVGSGSMENTMPAKSDLSSSKISLSPDAPWMGAGVMGNNDSGGSPTMSAADALPPILPELNSAATGNAPINPGTAVGNDIGNTGVYGGQGTGDMPAPGAGSGTGNTSP